MRWSTSLVFSVFVAGFFLASCGGSIEGGSSDDAGSDGSDTGLDGTTQGDGAVADASSCVPDCEGKTCGASDGCPGGSCQEGSGCTGSCQPTCTGVTCGQQNSCGTGICETGSGCTPVCTPTCNAPLCGQSNGCGGTCANTADTCVGVRCGKTNACGTVCSGSTRVDKGSTDRCDAGDCGCSSNSISFHNSWTCTGGGKCRIGGATIDPDFSCLVVELNESLSNGGKSYYCNTSNPLPPAEANFTNLCRNACPGYPGSIDCECN
ncbi:MAG: hypothetical protein IPJ88_00755 [Myxococcales bacterium]|nr:MAG: hypothetical protein IPJ88_00755 [Myxococcales bacterium]